MDTSQPVDVHGGDGAGLHTGVGLEVPKALLPLPRGQVDKAARLRLSAQTGFGSLLAHLLTQLASGTDSYAPADGPRLGTVVVDLLSALIAHALDSDSSLPPETRRQTLFPRIRAFVLGHLNDPGLTPPAIAAAHHISTSYLHRLFQQQGLTVSGWIRRQRLEHARRDLADPALRGTPVHVIASRWGFPQAADFSRAFRNAYGMPPKDDRHHHGSVLDGRPAHAGGGSG
ncbi:helix-turn-helix domain-containing protein [Streptomyces cinerochromogenes]|uniref:helix-turn-helix domain-containing protein n=1 Tax=Streptomyces cinerochromogenes TaxID=66422 RepID=UPI0036763450